MSRPWTGREILELRKMAASSGAREIAAVLGRSPEAIRSRAADEASRCADRSRPTALKPLPIKRMARAGANRWHNQPPIMRRVELAGCIGRPQLTVCLATAHS
jgi:hypothetical protein